MKIFAEHLHNSVKHQVYKMCTCTYSYHSIQECTNIDIFIISRDMYRYIIFVCCLFFCPVVVSSSSCFDGSFIVEVRIVVNKYWWVI